MLLTTSPVAPASLIVAAGALIGALIAAFVALRGQKVARAAALDVEKLRVQLQAGASDRDARRDYEYEARKRLYADVEPLLFQLVEAAEVALRRVSALAINAREGALSETSTWLTVMNEYYATYTMYQLMLPATIMRLIRAKPTFVDFGVDRKLRLQFHIAKYIYLLWRSDHDIRRAYVE